MSLLTVIPVETPPEEVEVDLTVPEGAGIDDPVRMYPKEIGRVPAPYARRGSGTGKAYGER